MTSGAAARRRIAERLREEVDVLTDEWLDRLGERLGVRPSRLLPTETLRDRIPMVLEGLSALLELPIAAPPNASVDLLRTVAQLRREQGYDIQELLVEFDILGELVFDRVEAWVAESDEPEISPAAVAGVCARLQRGLSGIGSVAVGTYREEELRHEAVLGERLQDFARMITHELMNPLHTIAASAHLLGEEGVAIEPDERRRHTDVITRRVQRIRDLVDEIRALSIAEGARAEPEWLPLSRVVENVTEETLPIAERYGVEVRVSDIEPFEVDAGRVEIALMNLLSNGIKFSDPGKDERWVEISAEPAQLPGLEGGRRIVVADNGLGIPHDLHNKVFQRFFRAHPEVAEGTGLGLEIVKRIVEQRGGRLAFESEVGQGTRFYIEVPQRPGIEGRDPHEMQPGGGSGSRKT